MKTVQLSCEIPANYTLLAMDSSGYCLAKSEDPDTVEPFVVWHVSRNSGEVFSGNYFPNAESATRYYAYLCFDWFCESRSQSDLDWTVCSTHRYAVYHGWLIVQPQGSETYYVYLPNEDFRNEEVVTDYAYLEGNYQSEWDCESLDEAIDFADDYNN